MFRCQIEPVFGLGRAADAIRPPTIPSPDPPVGPTSGIGAEIAEHRGDASDALLDVLAAGTPLEDVSKRNWRSWP